MKSSRPNTVFITGASSGFGAAIARRFAESGARVVVTARRADKLDELVGDIGSDLALGIALDVRDARAVEQVISQLPPAFAEIDCLINNAGLAAGMAPAHQASLDDWDRMVDTNCRGLVYVTRALLPAMIARRRGHIVNLGSVAGSYAYPSGNVYGASKAFVHQFSRNLRSDVHGTGVRVTCIEPGMCGGTEFSQVRFGGDKDKADAVYAGMQPLSAGDIADVVHWATSVPQHVNINSVELMPVAQSLGGFQVHRA